MVTWEDEQEKEEAKAIERGIYWIMTPDGLVRKPRDMMEYVKWWQTADRKIHRTNLGVCTISTVFLGINHDWFPSDNTAPVIFETMVFGGVMDTWGYRYRSLEDAKKGHWQVVFEVILAELQAKWLPLLVGGLFTIIVSLLVWWMLGGE